MAGADIDLVVYVRPYEDRDREQIEMLKCAPPGEPWCEAAERVIRGSPAEIATGAKIEIQVATVGPEAIGAIVTEVVTTDDAAPREYLLTAILPKVVWAPAHTTS